MLTLSDSAGETVVAADGVLDGAQIRRLKREVQLARARDLDTIVVDLAAVTMLDVLALGAILALDSDCSAAGQALEIVPPPGAVGVNLRLLGGAGRLRFRARR